MDSCGSGFLSISLCSIGVIFAFLSLKISLDSMDSALNSVYYINCNYMSDGRIAQTASIDSSF